MSSLRPRHALRTILATLRATEPGLRVRGLVEQGLAGRLDVEPESVAARVTAAARAFVPHSGELRIRMRMEGEELVVELLSGQPPHARVEGAAAIDGGVLLRFAPSPLVSKLPPRSIEVDPDLEEHVEWFVESRRRDVPQMRALYASRELRALRVIAHNLKGSGASFGYLELTAMGAAICEAIDEKDDALVEELLDKLAAFLGS